MTKRRPLSPVSAGLLALALAASADHGVGRRPTRLPRAPRAAPHSAQPCCRGLRRSARPTRTAQRRSPAHCVVRGSASPRTGADGKAYETRFELRLPTDVERPLPVSGRRRQRRHRGAGRWSQHGIVSGNRTPARLRRRDDRRRASGRHARVRPRSHGARRPRVCGPRADGDARPGDRGALLRPRARPAATSSAARAAAGRA